MNSLLLKYSRLVIIILLSTLMLACGSKDGTIFSSATVPRAANNLARELDRQILMRYAKENVDNGEAVARACIRIMGTTPVNLDTLTKSCPLARQMTEEISGYLMGLGYRYQELRKGSYIRFDRTTGELILTRNVPMLAQNVGKGQAILAGTYVISDQHVRFSMSLIHTLSSETIAKASASIPITPDILPLLNEAPVGGSTGPVLPNTYTKFR